ncbi:hypothetical protein AR437_10665 [Christensenella hongkongensis]|uniref:hypothetical protein n=1 Tax=Christensenella hongkongensis TaxID=270498 RepID=UPI0007403ADE|nr:hypothetical protein [Christensenella hongkongensis]KUJ28078.1 hypothetical protein AR437_10665 [Christensenella hongkongensis]
MSKIRIVNNSIVVKNPTAFVLPAINLSIKKGTTIYTVTGTYRGTKPLTQKLYGVMENEIESCIGSLHEKEDL